MSKHQQLSIGIISVLLSYCLLVFLFTRDNFADSGLSLSARPGSAASKDAIAIRVIANPKHYSPARWYKEQRFSGSPQSITVDGYDAVRDGRTVYVNVGNVSGSRLYTNIYLISYNQDAENATLDIFGQILSHWKFNKNIVAPGTCKTSTATTCVTDAGCPSGDYCLAPKAAVIRDTRRLADLADLESALDKYGRAHGYFPKLSSGSYLSNKTISTWPSWKAVLGSNLGISAPVDPINKLGDCGGGGYNPVTCWNETDKKFAGTVSGTLLTLPAGSHSYVYSASPDGSSYTLDMGTETGVVNADGTFTYNNIGSLTAIAGAVPGEAPYFSGSNFPNGVSGTGYSGYVEAKSPLGYPLTWGITRIAYQHDSSTVPVVWAGDSNSLAAEFLVTTLQWDSPVILGDTEVIAQKKLTALKMGKSGAYTFTFFVDDGRGRANSVATKDFTIKNIKNTPPALSILKPVQDVIIGKSLDYIVAKASDRELHYPLSFSLAAAGPRAPSLVCTTEEISEIVFKFQCRITGNPVVADTKEHIFNLTVADYYGEQTNGSFIVSIKNNPPDASSISLSETDAIIACPYTANVNATDPDGHLITQWLATGLPSGLSMDNSTGIISGSVSAAGTYPFDVAVRDRYFSNTVSPYSAEASKGLSVTAADFTLSSIPNSTIYNYPPAYPTPASGFHPLYHPAGYAEQAVVSLPGSDVVYSLISPSPSWLAVNASGTIQGTPSATGNFSVDLRATKNPCGISRNTIFSLAVLQNEWCGDTIVQLGQGEQCDTTGYSILTSPTRQYECEMAGANSCKGKGGWCGDSAIQAGHGENCDNGPGANGAVTGPVYDNARYTYSYCNASCQQVAGNNYFCGDNIINGSENCDGAGGAGTGPNDQYGCSSSCTWTGGWYGDGVINGAEQCEGTDFNGRTCASFGYLGDASSLACVNGAIDAGNCDRYLGAGINPQGVRHTVNGCLSAGGSLVDAAGNATGRAGAIFCKMPYTRDTCASIGMAYRGSSYDGYQFCWLNVIGESCYGCDDGMDCCDSIFDTAQCTNVGGAVRQSSVSGNCFLNNNTPHCGGNWSWYGNWTSQTNVYSQSCGSNCYDHGCFNGECGGMCHGWQNFFTSDYYNYCDYNSTVNSYNGVAEIGCY